MKKVCLQAGHVGRTSGATGAPEEMANNKRIVDRLSAVLRSKGIEVYQTDAYGYNDKKVTQVDYDLFLSVHCDMDYSNDQGGGFSDFANPDKDKATIESQRISKIINEIYFPEVKIDYKPRVNLNTRNYYMWDYLTPKTPCVIIEMGQSIDPHDKVLLANTDLIANALAKSICVALGVTYEIENTNTSNNIDYKQENERLVVENNNLKNALIKAKTDFDSALAVKESECQAKIEAYKIENKPELEFPVSEYIIKVIKVKKEK